MRAVAASILAELTERACAARSAHGSHQNDVSASAGSRLGNVRGAPPRPRRRRGWRRALGRQMWDVPLTELQLGQAIIRHMTRRVDLLKMWPVVLAAILVGA